MLAKQPGSSYIPSDTHLPIAQMLNAEEVLYQLKSVNTKAEIVSCKVKRVRYSPSISCIVTYEADIKDEDNTISTVLLYSHAVTTKRMRKFQRHFNRRTWTPGKVLEQPLSYNNETQVLFEFPNDFRLKALSKIINPDELNTLIKKESQQGNLQLSTSDAEPSVTLLRYKPETRLVLLWESVGQKIVLRCDQPAKSSRGYSRLQHLHAMYVSSDRIGVPTPLFCNDENGISAISFVEGSMLPELLKTVEVGDHIARTAETLSVLHGRKVEDLPVKKHIEVLALLGRSLAVLSLSSKEIASETAYLKSLLIQILERGVSEEQGFVHGDFHQGQVLCDTEKDWILDFDRSHVGDQIADVGNFMAQLDILEVRGRIVGAEALGIRFCSAYEAANGKAIPENNLKFWRGVGLLGLAAKEFRRLKPTWPERIPQILEKCQRMLKN